MLFSKPHLSALALLTVTTASPTSPSPSPKLYAIPQLARFENSDKALPLAAVFPVGIYLDILFKGFVAVSNGINGMPLAGLVPQSPPNDIGYGGLNLPTLTQGPPTMTVVYPDTIVQYFDLEFFYFGCAVALDNGLADPVAACTVTATCTNPAGEPVKSQDFFFAKTGGATQNLVKATPVGFKGCQSVTFKTTAKDKALQADTGTAIDTIKYTVYSTKPLSP